MDVSLVMFKSDGERRDFPLTNSTVILGRKHSCDLRIPLSSVSREHCQIERRDDGLYLRDLGSSNGTYHNEVRIHEVKLTAGDQIVVGPVHMTLVVNGEPTDVQPVQTIMPDGSGEVEEGEPASATEPKVIARPEAPRQKGDDLEELEALKEAAPAPGTAAAPEAEQSAPAPTAASAEPELEVEEIDIHGNQESDAADDDSIFPAGDDDEDDEDPIAALEGLLGGESDSGELSDDDFPDFGDDDDDDDSVPIFDEEDER